jgi:hypothetical protein
MAIACALGELWFQGHWGFQYYMQSSGASSLDFNQLHLQAGDLIATPSQNTNLRQLDLQKTAPLETVTTPVGFCLATGSTALGAGFYGSSVGPLPFAFGPVPPEKVFVDVWGSQQ